MEVIQFAPRRDAEASRNVSQFVALAREKLTVFGSDLDFEANSWEVSDSVPLKGKAAQLFSIRFSNHDTSKATKGSWTPMAEPFLSFAKAYLRYMHGLRPVKCLGVRLSALRALERALSRSGEPPRIDRANLETFTYAASLVRAKYGGSAYRAGKELEGIADFCTKNFLTRTALQWRSPLRRPHDKNRVGDLAEKRRAEKMPSAAALEALPKLFWLAQEPRDLVLTSLAVILCSSPNRMSELITLRADCEVGQRYKGKTVYGLRWWPAKGAEPTVNWVVPSMVEVVKKAIARLRTCSSEARKIARWYEEHPDRIYLREELEHLRRKELLSNEEASLILGIAPLSLAAWHANQGFSKNRGFCRFEEIERGVLKLLPRHFPLIDPETELRYSDAMCILPYNGLHGQRGTYACMIEPVTVNAFNQHFGNIFSRFGFTEPDGSPIKVTSNQFRHWINTLAQRGGLSQLDIAKWSNRKDIRENQAYDHMSGEELLLKLRQIAGDERNLAGLPVEQRQVQPVAREEFLKMLIPAAHTTELGFCVHDWVLLPCQMHRDCLLCPEHCYLKGEPVRERRIRQCLGEAEQQLESAEAAVQEEFAGADRWLEHQRAVVGRLRNLVEILDRRDCPQGTMIRLAAGEPPSRIRLAMEARRHALPDPGRRTRDETAYGPRH